ncbi:hypothetical protein ACFLXQ_08685 [Chloroflexota bacterium]
MISRFTFYTFRWQSLLFWLGTALIVGLFYLTVSTWNFGYFGFPLDDAWIHQTYARNLAHSGQLAFVPGVPSAGSTAPLWSFMLSVGYWLGIPFKIWAYGLGLIFLGLTGWTVARLGRRLFPKRPPVGLWAGLFCVFEWHLVWAAVSGMETILFVWLSVFLVERYLAVFFLESVGQTVSLSGRGQAPTCQPANPSASLRTGLPFSHFLGLGILGGLLILTRPEGLGLVGLIGLDIAYRWWRQAQTKNISALLQNWLGIVVGVGLLLAPYMLFHLWLTGQPFPNTFYAKQAEYGVVLQAYPLWWRLFGNFGPSVESVQGVFRVIFIGPQILLLPGLCFAAWLTFKERRSVLVLIWLWWISFLLLYAVRLPVTYQHGRYQIPAIPWVILLGVWGTARLLSLSPQGRHERFVMRVVRPAMALSLIVSVPAFTMLVGAQAYGRDVRFIESEMVATARWLNEHVESDALIAAHDIGAIGYFTQRPLIDLAGLITPAVIPIIRDETALFDFILAREADYLVTFPSWYPDLTQNSALDPRNTTNAPWTRQAGADNMMVYQIMRPPSQP